MYNFYPKKCVQLPRCTSKILLVMKLTTLLMIAIILQVSAKSFAQKVTLSEKNVPINKIFDEIRQQTGFDFLVTRSMLKEARPITIDVKNQELTEVLKNVFSGQTLNYTIQDKYIVVSQKKESLIDKLLTIVTAIDVRGRIIDEDNKPLAGATIIVKGQNMAVTTQRDGTFYLKNVNKDAVIRISFIGYLTKEISVSANMGDIGLELDNSKLNEVKVIGYGTTTERLTTGDISTITAKDIENQPVNNILDAMAGRIPGIQITPKSGLPGAAPTVQVRGNNSIAQATNPLYILDGVPVNPVQNVVSLNPLDFSSVNLLLGINPSDVESISVLKDADATAIYGSRGADGVILITTKRGKNSGLKVNANVYTGIANLPHTIDLLDVHQYNAMRREGYANDKITPTAIGAPDLLSWDSTKVHNWQKELLGKTAESHDANLSLSGGSENTHFYINSAWHREGSVMPGNSELDRKSFLATLSHNSKDNKFNLEVQSSYSISSLNMLAADLVTFIFAPPDYPIYNPDGSLNLTAPLGNPYATTRQIFSDPTKNFGTNAKISYQFIDGLTARISAGFNSVNTQESLAMPLNSLNPQLYSTGSLQYEQFNSGNWIVEPQLEYKHNFGKNHLDLLAGSTFQKSYNNSLTINGTNYVNDALITNIGSAGLISSVISTSTPYAYTSFYSRATYDFNQEYLANVTYRRDGSSRFGPGKQFGNFGALGLGWIFTKENWVAETLPFLSFGKLRSSYGVTGSDNIPDYGYLSTYYAATGSGGYDGTAALRASRLANPDYRWEVNKKLEGAVDLGFLKDRILVSAAYFRDRSSNQLVSYQISAQTGFTSYVANFPATVQNTGWEFDVTTRNVSTANFQWNTNLNFTKTSNKLVAFPNIAASSYSQTYVVGQSLNLLQAYVFKGLSNTGVPIIADLNKDGQITSADRVLAGNDDPRYGGIGNNFTYKNFKLSFFIQYTRYRGYSNFYPQATPGRYDNNFSTYVLGRWQQPGDEATTVIPRFTSLNSTYDVFANDATVQSIITSNVFRLSNASIAYNVPGAWVKKLKLSNLEIYVNGQNLYTLDKYAKWRLDPGTGNSALPPLRTIAFGLNVTF
jgi:TonB-linked SusC/RagA family outer membrane protein